MRSTPNPNMQRVTEVKVTIAGTRVITLNIKQDVLDRLSEVDAVAVLEDAINGL
jgi:hypothetical protein